MPFSCCRCALYVVNIGALCVLQVALVVFLALSNLSTYTWYHYVVMAPYLVYACISLGSCLFAPQTLWRGAIHGFMVAYVLAAPTTVLLMAHVACHVCVEGANKAFERRQYELFGQHLLTLAIFFVVTMAARFAFACIDECMRSADREDQLIAEEVRRHRGVPHEAPARRRKQRTRDTDEDDVELRNVSLYATAPDG